MDSFIIFSCELLLEFLVIILVFLSLFPYLFLLLFEFFVVKQLVFSLLDTLSHDFVHSQFSFVLLLDHYLNLVIRRKKESFFEDHLRHCSGWCGVELDLGEEVVDRLDEVFVEVEVIMGHLSRHHQKCLTSTFSFQFLGLREGNERVLLPVQDEGRTEDFGHQSDVLEPFLD